MKNEGASANSRLLQIAYHPLSLSFVSCFTNICFYAFFIFFCGEIRQQGVFRRDHKESNAIHGICCCCESTKRERKLRKYASIGSYICLCWILLDVVKSGSELFLA